MKTRSAPIAHLVVALLTPLALVACSGDAFEPTPKPGDDSEAGKVLGGLDPAKLDTAEAIAQLSGAASAPNVFGISMLAMVLVQTSDDPTCPKKTEGSSVITYEGGCTDKNGTQWVGTVQVTGGKGATSSEAVYTGFGQTKQVTCGDTAQTSSLVFNGTSKYSAAGAKGFDFEVDMRGEAGGVDEDHCQPALGGIGWEYEGTVAQSGPDADADGKPDDTLWNGHGRVGSTEVGVVEATTKDELIRDEGCATEADSGTTSLHGAHAVVITYDGATDCDDPGTAKYSVDGVEKGEIEGVQCSVTAPGAADAAGAWLGVLGVCMALASRRRRSR